MKTKIKKVNKLIAYFSNSSNSKDEILSAFKVELDEEQSQVAYGFNLSTKSGFASAEIDFNILKSFAKKYSFDEFELLGIYKRIINETRD